MDPKMCFRHGIKGLYEYFRGTPKDFVEGLGQECVCLEPDEVVASGVCWAHDRIVIPQGCQRLVDDLTREVRTVTSCENG